MEIVKRADAAKNGLTKYFTGEPCVNGHVAVRYVRSGACYECIRANVDRERERFDAARKADGSAEARAAFARDALSVRLLTPLRSVPSLHAMAAALMLGRFPTLAEKSNDSWHCS